MADRTHIPRMAIGVGAEMGCTGYYGRRNELDTAMIIVGATNRVVRKGLLTGKGDMGRQGRKVAACRAENARRGLRQDKSVAFVRRFIESW